MDLSGGAHRGLRRCAFQEHSGVLFPVLDGLCAPGHRFRTLCPLPLPAVPEQTLQAAIKQALAHRPDVIAALSQIDSAEASLKGARRAYYPVVAVSAHASQNMGAVSSDGKPYSGINRPGANILLSISVPIYDGGMRSSQISVAQAKVRAAEDKLDQTRDSAAQQVCGVRSRI